MEENMNNDGPAPKVDAAPEVNNTNDQAGATDNSSDNATSPQSGGDNSPGGNNIMAAISYLGILVIIPFLTESKNDPYVKFHIKQGLALLVTGIIGWIISVIPVIGWIISPIIGIILLILMIIGLINALTGKTKQLPVIGKYGDKFKI